jgi:antirestriction protein ArdC
MMQTPEAPTNLDVYSIVTNHFMILLQQGIVPWLLLWNDREPPQNLITKRPYRGVNTWLLLSTPYERNLYLSWEQLKEVGGSVKRGEHGHIVIYSNKFTTDNEGKQIPLLRYYKVFNIAQCTGIPPSLIPPAISDKADPLASAVAIIENMPLCPPIKYVKQKVLYDAATDCIHMARLKTFPIPTLYYRTLFRQLIHSTGHSSRLNRSTPQHDSDSYNTEAFIAELGASYLCSLCGIDHADVKYDWVYFEERTGMLIQDKAFILSASSHAQRAVDFILNLKRDVDEDQNGG